ncbi:MAG: T9SS type A sorting domain-containing protein [candidate division Zixibacteria bacterium]|nr:T9SS type A sorting domain-containing protein [candidate division Zixibacteria bacterium]MBU1471908.1 T9SS type A sorting domain-containing protein [candidate division Zixibacteria bacterium]
MRTVSFAVQIVLVIFSAAHAAPLSSTVESQVTDIIRGWSGEQMISTSSMIDLIGYQPVKCGTPAILSVQNIVRQASPKVQEELSLLLEKRYNQICPDTVGSLDDHFLIHYASSGTHAPANPTVDNNGNGIPDYIDQTAMIFDSVWTFQMGELGFEPPLSDGFYPAGIDDRYDVYVFDLSTGANFPGVYGATFPDTTVVSAGRPKSTSFIIIENDYAGASFGEYQGRPLDALRVTAAHEFFHAVQFGYDPFEFELGLVESDPNDDRTQWMEMSAVWMEEQAFDYVNDYYFYLPTFHYNCNWSLRTGRKDGSIQGTYQYAAVVWPLYLSQTFGSNTIRRIWEECAAISGPNVFQNAFDDVIREVSSDEQDFSTALSEFYVWNYFTASRAIDGFGYEEAADFGFSWAGQWYPSMIPEVFEDHLGETPFIQEFRNFPLIEYYPAADPPDGTGFKSWPDYLGANYIRLKPAGLDSIRFILDGEVQRVEGSHDRDTVDFDWKVRVATVNFEVDGGTVNLDPVIYSNVEELIARDLHLSTETLVVLVPYAQTKYARIHNDVAYKFTIPDTTEAILATAVSEPFPNPLVLSEVDQVRFNVEQPLESLIKMDVFTVAGEKVIEKAQFGNLITWNGRNESGELVASGLYIVYVKVGDQTEIFKVAVIE